MNHKQAKLTVFLVVIAAVVTAGTYLLLEQGPAPSETPAMIKYTNAQHGYEIEHPAGWDLTEHATVCQEPWFCIQGTFLTHPDEGEVYIWVNFQGGWCEGTQGMQITEIEVSGEAGQEYLCPGFTIRSFEGWGSIIRYFRNVDGKNYFVLGQAKDGLTKVTEIVRSFAFIPPAPVAQPADACIAPTEVCNKAMAVARALLAVRDVDWLTQNYPPQEVACSRDVGLGPPPSPVCDGAEDGELREAYVFTVDEQGGMASPDQFKQVLHSWLERPTAASADAYGAPYMRLYTIGCAAPTSTGQLCLEYFVLVFSKTTETGQRDFMLLFMSASPRPQLVSVYFGEMPDPAKVEVALRGGDTLGFFGPSGRPWTFFLLR